MFNLFIYLLNLNALSIFLSHSPESVCFIINKMWILVVELGCIAFQIFDDLERCIDSREFLLLQAVLSLLKKSCCQSCVLTMRAAANTFQHLLENIEYALEVERVSSLPQVNKITGQRCI